MTPAKRRQATPATQGPARVAPDVPVAGDPTAGSPSETKEGAQLLGPEGEPLAHEDSAPEAAGQAEPADQSPAPARRPGGLYPLPVWPD